MDALLLEDGTPQLLEDGTELLLEAQTVIATGYTISGPASGRIGSARTFTYTAKPEGALFVGDEVFTPSATGLTGGFNAATVTPTAGASSGTLTFTGSAEGSGTIGLANDQAWTEPSAIAFTVTSASTASRSGGMRLGLGLRIGGRRGGVRYDASALVQFARIEADAGQVEDKTFVSRIIAALKNGGAAGDCYALLDAMWLPSASKIDGARKVSKLYDLAPAKSGSVYYDATQTTAINQQSLTSAASGLDGKAVVQFNRSSAGVYVTGTIETKAQPLHVFAVARRDGADIGSGIIDATGTTARSYYEGGNLIAIYGGSFVSSGTTASTWGQFTFSINGASSAIRRARVQRVAGNAGALGTSGTLQLGRSQTYYHNGPIAAWLLVRQSISTAQRDHIESVLATYYPSAQ